MESLPAEILLQISQHLDSASLAVLALTSKRCSDLAVVILHRDATVEIGTGRNSGPPLLTDEYVAQRLSRMHRRHVRKLTIIAEDGDYHPASTDPYWTPLVHLLDALPSSLSSLVWECASPFPACLSEVLRRRLPACVLHLTRFTLNHPSQTSLSAEDLAIATLPNLGSILFKYDDYGADGEPDYTLEAVARIVAGLAPNLRHIRAVWAQAASTADLIGAYQSTRSLVLQDLALPRGGHEEKTRGGLTELELAGGVETTAPDLELWARCTDFSKLQTLKIDNRLRPDSMAYLVSSSSSSTFNSLSSLSLCLSGLTDDDMQSTIMVEELFRNLTRPLKSLSLQGALPRASLARIIQFCGGGDSDRDSTSSGLQALALRPSGSSPTRLVLNAADLLTLSSLCGSSLRTFTLSISRTRGDAREVAAYKILGSFPRLSAIRLTLDAADFDTLREPPEDDDEMPEIPSDSTFDEFDELPFRGGPFRNSWGQAPRNGHIRDALINSAVDRTLALAIFDVINGDVRRLQELDVMTTGGGNFGTGSILMSIEDLVQHVARPWRMRRQTTVDGGGDEVAIENMSTSGEHHCRPHRVLGQEIEPIFRKIWPVKEGSEGWWDDWESWPLML